MVDLLIKQGTSYATAEGDVEDWGAGHIGGTWNLGGTANITGSAPGVDTQLSATLDWVFPDITLEVRDT